MMKQNLGKILGLALGCLIVVGVYSNSAKTAKEPDNPLISQPAVTADAAAAPVTTEAAATEKPAPSALSAIREYVVQEGDTLSTIAENFNIDVETIIGANPKVSHLIHPGDKLIILPQKGVVHVVKSGDTLWDIARVYDVDIDKILAANAKTTADLAIGDKLFIPGARPLRQETAPVSRSGGTRFIWPTRGEFSSAFGYRWGRLHAGIDIANDIGTPVRAAAAGRVIFTGWLSGYGYAIEMDHGQGYTTLYAHLSQYVVTPGEFVREGTVIGYMGNTGFSTGPHLHFEVRRSGQPINPLQVLP